MKVLKKAIRHTFRIAAFEEVVRTKEGLVTAGPGDAVLTGVQGELWPIRWTTFEATYDYDLASMTCAKQPLIVEAYRMDEPFEVRVGEANEPIRGVAGDYRLASHQSDFGIVSKDIFELTYAVVDEGPTRVPGAPPDPPPGA